MNPISIEVPIGKSTFIPAGCLHYPIGEKDLLLKWVKEVEEAENGFTILMGDSLDSVRTHYRKHLKGYLEDENSQLALDEWNRKDVQDLAKILKPIAKRIKGIILGNHFWAYGDGTNSDQYLAELLSVPYLGPAGLLRLDFKRGKKTVHKATVFTHHAAGSRGGRTTAADISALERTELSFDADIYVLSHTHRRFGFRQPTLSLTSKGSPRVVERTKVFIRSGAFLKGYADVGNGKSISTAKPHFPTYAEAAALRPTDLGWIRLELDCKTRKVGVTSEYYLDYTIVS